MLFRTHSSSSSSSSTSSSSSGSGSRSRSDSKKPSYSLISSSSSKSPTSFSCVPSEQDWKVSRTVLEDHFGSVKTVEKIVIRIGKSLEKLPPSLKRAALDLLQIYEKSSQEKSQEKRLWERQFLDDLIMLRMESIKKISKSTYSLCSNPTVDFGDHLQSVQACIDSLGYNHVGSLQLFTIKKGHPFYILMRTAKDILRHRLPIKCLEAVVLAM